MARRKKRVEPNDNNLAIAYYRYSSHSQNEASIEQQQEAAKEFADAKGYQLVREYEDRAISGTTDERPGYQQMLSEVGKLKPAVLILWKADRLGRDRFETAIARKTLRDAGCRVLYVAEAVPDDDSPEAALMESMLDGMADYYSKQLARNIRRGVAHNAERALSNGHKIFGYLTDPDTRKYVKDPDAAPVVEWVFHEYADGRRLQDIADSLNQQGHRTGTGGMFNIHGLRRILKNDRYIGVYRCGDVVIEDGMPRIVDDDTFNRVQDQFAKNKRKAPHLRHGTDEDGNVRYWLTGKLFCGECGHSMQSTHGTSSTGAKHHYYGCGNKLKRRGCTKKNIRKEVIEDLVIKFLHGLLDDTEVRFEFAHAAAEHCRRAHGKDGYLAELENRLKETDKGIWNIVSAIEGGTISEALTSRLAELESAKSAIEESIDAEKFKLSLMEDEESIGAYFAKYAQANFDDPLVRDEVLDYFVEKIYVYDDKKLVVVGSFAEGRGRYEADWNLGGWDLGFEPFDKFAQGSTTKMLQVQKTICFV